MVVAGKGVKEIDVVGERFVSGIKIGVHLEKRRGLHDEETK